MLKEGFMEENCNTNSCNNCEECKKVLVFEAAKEFIKACLHEKDVFQNQNFYITYATELANKLYDKVYGK